LITSGIVFVLPLPKSGNPAPVFGLFFLQLVLFDAGSFLDLATIARLGDASGMVFPIALLLAQRGLRFSQMVYRCLEVSPLTWLFSPISRLVPISSGV